MTTYLQMIEDDRGDLTDIVYWHGRCAPLYVREMGEWPCPEAVDYPVVCGPIQDGYPKVQGCGERVYEVPLTDAGLAYVSEWDNWAEWLDGDEIERGRDLGYLPAEVDA